LLTIAPKSS